ncbi:MAG: UV DNA damage repair endonuclease UvsE [Candidatus Lokiarchaeota archaeon]|nr:UV DNA damage repair endonuclease UvsE [Candidatus Lokiarchaeota archaeon]
MKIGYTCINQSLSCRSSNTFRLKNYSKKRLIEVIEGNLNCLEKILTFNKSNGIYFFRITSGLVPFASHSIMDFNWQDHFKHRFRELGTFVKKNEMRISMHPGQYIVLNSTNPAVYEKSIKDLKYHVELLDLMELDANAKVQVHVGGVYGDKTKSLKRFISRYYSLEEEIKRRLVIENDDKSYALRDCMEIHDSTNIPVIFDVYHHACFNCGESIQECFEVFIKTWKEIDGLPIVHYSSQHPDKGKGSHSDTMDVNNFRNFIDMTKNFDFDLMLEIKEKEIAALKALKYLITDSRLIYKLS